VYQGLRERITVLDEEASVASAEQRRVNEHRLELTVAGAGPNTPIDPSTAPRGREPQSSSSSSWSCLSGVPSAAMRKVDSWPPFAIFTS
jgi:hypothetical protein